MDLATWKLHGLVKTMQSTIAVWDRVRQQWQPARHHTSVTFDGHGRVIELDQPGAAGSVHRTIFLYDVEGRLTEVTYAAIGAPPQGRRLYYYDSAGRLERVVDGRGGVERTASVCEYDASGRKKKTDFLPAETSGGTFYGLEGSETSYGVPGAATLTTLYDERDRPAEAAFHDATGARLRTITFTRDSAGRIVTEEARTAQGAGAQFEDILGHIPADNHAAVVAMLVGAAPGSIATRFAYDSEGRLVERQRHMGTVGEERATFAYDDHGNPIEERTEHRDREMRVEENGSMRPTADTLRSEEARFEYTYDGEGNWTERVVSVRFGPDTGFERDNVERRAIEYYDNSASR